MRIKERSRLKILGIDTSSRVLSIAFGKDDSIAIEENHLLDKMHSSFLIPKIKGLLDKAGVSIEEVDGFIVGLGPGSFTGLRIGVSAVKGFGIAMKKPCIGIPSIDCIAMNADGKSALVVPIIDAKRNQVYCGIYKKEKDSLIRKSNYLLLDIDRLLKKIKGDAVFLGDGIDLYKDRIIHVNKKLSFLDEDCWYPKAGNLIRLGFDKIKNNRKSNLSMLQPIYLYPKDCQVRK